MRHDAVIYQIDARSFSDSDGDGVGDVGGIIDRLGYLELLGVDALWLNPAAEHLDDLRAEANERAIGVTEVDSAPVSIDAPWSAADVQHAITAALGQSRSDHAPTWNLASSLVGRYAEQDSLTVGTDRARALALVLFALPGRVVIGSGAELGLPQSADSNSTPTPLPWEGSAPPFGFSAAADGAVHAPADWASLTVEAQLEDVTSTLSLYRHAIELRRERTEFEGVEVDWYGAPDGCVAFRRGRGADTGHHLVCALNAGTSTVGLPDGKRILCSNPAEDGQLPPNSAAWLITEPAH